MKLKLKKTWFQETWNTPKIILAVALSWYIFAVLQFLFLAISGGSPNGGWVSDLLAVLFAPFLFFIVLVSGVFHMTDPFFLSILTANVLVFATLYLLFSGISMFFTSFSKEVKNKLFVLLFSFTQIFHWAALMFSEQRINNIPESIYSNFASAGFPFQVFTYPHPPMGNDMVPLAMWPQFYWHYGFWMSIALLLSLFLLRNKKFTSDKLKFLFLFSLGILLFGISYILFKFD